MPSDAVDMLVVHRVFRREFRGMPALITGVSAGDTARATVVGNHLAFMVAALHHHHAAEDDMVWPILTKRAPQRKADIDRMAAEHAEISEAVDRVQAMLATWTTSAESSLGERLSAASFALSTSVDRHLDDEERSALPLIEEYLTQQEWAAVVKQAASFISARNLRLGIVLGGLVLDDASVQERRKILSGAPLPQRWIMVLFGARTLAAYRRRMRATAVGRRP